MRFVSLFRFLHVNLHVRITLYNMKIKYNLNFKLEQRRDKQSGTLIVKNVPINMELTYLGKRLYYYVGYRIDADKWIDSVLDSTGKKQRYRRQRKTQQIRMASNTMLSTIVLMNLKQRLKLFSVKPEQITLKLTTNI